jgi:transmembrane sensor
LDAALAPQGAGPVSQTRYEAIEATAATWLAHRDSGHWTRDDERALQAWLDQDSAHRVAWLRLDAAWQCAEQMKALTRREASSMPAATTMRMAVHPSRRFATRWAAAAMVTIAMMLGVISMITQVPTSDEEWYSTPVGGLEAVTLADGSRLTLNTRTRARAVINDRERKVWLEEGEAFFEVQHDPARPFVVTAGGDRITVLGTKFSVRHEVGRTQVTVLEGRVRLDQARPGVSSREIKPESTLVTNNDSAVLQSGGVLVIAKTTAQVQHVLSWRQGRLVFDQKPLGEIAAEFNRYNRKQLIVEGDAAAVRLGGSFDAHNVEAFARLVHEGFGLKLDQEQDTIKLSSD